MSTINKATDRNRNGRIERKYTGPAIHSHPWGVPGWWVPYHMTRPRRRTNKAFCREIMKGNIHPDQAAFPLGSRKPYIYYY